MMQTPGKMDGQLMPLMNDLQDSSQYSIEIPYLEFVITLLQRTEKKTTLLDRWSGILLKNKYYTHTTGKSHLAGMKKSEGRSLPETPTWAVATVVIILVGVGIFFHGCLMKLGKWLRKTKRKPLLAALEKIKDELMLFGLLSLLMGHWIIYVSKVCVKSSGFSRHFYLCAAENGNKRQSFVNHLVFFDMESLNTSFSLETDKDIREGFCPEGHEPFASYESLEQLHRLLFVLGITHVLYSFYAVALTVLQMHSWRKWENHAMELALQASAESNQANKRMTRLTTFVSHHTSHPWSSHRIFVWLLCFSRQFWSSINQADYRALRSGFITTHELPVTYDFHKYMLRSMEEEFRDIVGISIPLWIFAILCILLGVHGTNVYFWLSFSPIVLVLLIGTKLHVIVVKLAVEIMDATSQTEIHILNLRDELFWFGKPRLLLWLIQFITFQNAFEMAMYIWSLWEIRGASCFTGNLRFLVIRLMFGIVSQFWCSFITFPLYVIVTQMGSMYKKSIVSKNVRKSIREWKTRAVRRLEGTLVSSRNTSSSMTLELLLDQDNKDDEANDSSKYANYEDICRSSEVPAMDKFEQNEILPCDEEEYQNCGEFDYDVAHKWDIYDMERNRDHLHSQEDEKDSSSLLH